MTLSRFRVFAIALVAFNIVGTVLTWIAHLQKPGTSLAHAFGDGTEFTGPIFLIVLSCIAFAMTYVSRRFVWVVGVAWLGLWGLGFAFGETTELFKHNVGVSSGKWDAVLALSVIGLVVGIVCAVGSALTLRESRRASAVGVTA